MSFESQVSELQFATDGVTTVFGLANQDGALFFMDGADIAAVFVDAAGAVAELVQATDFTVSGDGRTGSGTLITTMVKPDGGVLRAWCDTAIVQPEHYQENDGFPAATHETAQDRHVMMVRDLARRQRRALSVPDYEDPVLPIPPVYLRADRPAAYDSDGNPSAPTFTTGQLEVALQGAGLGLLPGGTLGALASTASLLGLFGAPVVLANGTSFVTSGRDAPGDGGGGTFYYDSADVATADNGGTVRVDAQGRRWKYNGRSYFAGLFGARFDGITDDTAALISAHSNIYAAGGGILWLPRGTAKVSTLPLHWAASISVKMIGAGSQATVLSKIGTDTDPVLDISADTGVLDVYSEFSDFSIAGNGRHADGVRATTITSCTTRNLKITNCDIGFHALGAIGWSHFGFAWNSNNKGYLQDKSGAIYPNQNQFFGGSMKANLKASLDIVRGFNWAFYGLDCENNGTNGDATTGQIFIRSTVDEETGVCTGSFNNVDLEAALSKNITVENAAGLRLSMKGINTSSSGAGGVVMTVGTIASLSLDEFIAASPGDTATIAAVSCTIRNSTVNATDTSTSREYTNITNSSGFIRRGSSSCGSAVLVAGTNVVAHPNLKNGDVVLVTVQAPGGTPGLLSVARTAGVGFTINSASNVDTSTVAWQVLSPV